MKKLTNKQVLELYSFCDNEQLKSILAASLPDYFTLVDSEKAASDYLESHGKKYYYPFEERKVKFDTMIRCAELRKIKINYSKIPYEVSDQDVIDRMDENLALELKSIISRFDSAKTDNFDFADSTAKIVKDTISEYTYLKDKYVKDKIDQKRIVKRNNY